MRASDGDKIVVDIIHVMPSLADCAVVHIDVGCPLATYFVIQYSCSCGFSSLGGHTVKR
jgi:hypothetical protein